MSGNANTAANTMDGLQQRLLEQELDMQLAMLRQETPPSTLFEDTTTRRQDVANMGKSNSAFVPPIQESSSASKVEKQPLQSIFHSAEVELGNEEALLGHNTESVAEAFVICTALMAVFVAPTLF